VTLPPRTAPPRPLSIQKDRQYAVIYLLNYRVAGTVHVAPGGRISDFINRNVSEGPFIPLTDVTVYATDGDEVLFSTEFMAVHRNHILFMTVDKEAPTLDRKTP
jgi:hypothetical protein